MAKGGILPVAEIGILYLTIYTPPLVGEPAGGVAQTNLNITNGAPAKTGASSILGQGTNSWAFTNGWAFTPESSEHYKRRLYGTVHHSQRSRSDFASIGAIGTASLCPGSGS